MSGHTVVETGLWLAATKLWLAGGGVEFGDLCRQLRLGRGAVSDAVGTRPRAATQVCSDGIEDCARGWHLSTTWVPDFSWDLPSGRSPGDYIQAGRGMAGRMGEVPACADTPAELRELEPPP